MYISKDNSYIFNIKGRLECIEDGGASVFGFDYHVCIHFCIRHLHQHNPCDPCNKWQVCECCTWPDAAQWHTTVSNMGFQVSLLSHILRILFFMVWFCYTSLKWLTYLNEYIWKVYFSFYVGSHPDSYFNTCYYLLRSSCLFSTYVNFANFQKFFGMVGEENWYGISPISKNV